MSSFDNFLQAFKSSRVFMSFNLRFQSKRSLDNTEDRLFRELWHTDEKKTGHS